ncbi:MAG: amidohydrolase family protein [Aeromicrobium sp.]
MTHRTHITGGHVVTLDPTIGTIADGDVLIEDGTIIAVGTGLHAIDAEVIDASGTIVVPGFIDTHRHTWETVLRGMLPDCTLDGYLASVAGSVGPAFGPADVFAGTLLGSLEALSAGITTLVDWSHCNNTPQHADAGIAALRETGTRAMYAHGTPAHGEWWVGSDHPHPDDARRVRAEHFSSDADLLTFAIAARGPGVTTPAVVEHDWRLARELGARISVHVGMRITGMHINAVDDLHRAGLMGADTTYVHASDSSDAELDLIAATGGTLSIAPYVEMLMGHGHPPVGRSIRSGIAPSLSIDVATSAPGDMFTQMRTALIQDRIRSFGDDVDVAFAPTLSHTDVLQMATRNGAAACGLSDRVGSLTPGKDADIVMIRSDALNTMPVIDPVATVVTSADTSNVDTVMVRGRILKRHGQLVDVDLARVRDLAENARDDVLRRAGLGPTQTTGR